jgi:hypothetical protein
MSPLRRSMVLVAACGTAALAIAQEPGPRAKTSYAPVAGTEPFDSVMKRMSEAKPGLAEQHRALLAGVRVKLSAGAEW